jgi:hypothetical protein
MLLRHLNITLSFLLLCNIRAKRLKTAKRMFSVFHSCLFAYLLQ